MQSDLFLLPFLSAFLVTIASGFVLLRIPFFRKQSWRNGERHTGKESVARLGGVAMCLAFIVAIILDPHLVLTHDTWGLIVGAIVACLFGLWDDFLELSFKAQAFLQVSLTTILFVFGLRITTLKNPFGDAWMLPEQSPIAILLGFVLLFGWLALVMNAVNWLDGLDGLLGGVSLVTFFVIFFLSLKPEVNQPPVALLSVIGAGLTLGFLVFNVHPAKLLAGTSGSMFIGLLITALAVIAGTKVATALLVLSLPIADALWVIGERLRSGESIFQPDQRHLHYKLRGLGWSEHQIAGLFFALTACVGLIALNTEALGKLIAFFLVFGIIFSVLFFVAHTLNKKHHRIV
ncbi:MAG: undecaprenyl/decaprenyl-phosphate alpha-N-acetylglucosaminyl 1-phosphate transferase [Candidatus Moranbacteria bacterium]|nr:undecaprenyl/decaprenyl-phosphate alpha-N-acetylglucosaminyl 1-phosphate transferase [Candidatus Moranbacteria bacterium]